MTTSTQLLHQHPLYTHIEHTLLDAESHSPEFQTHKALQLSLKTLGILATLAARVSMVNICLTAGEKLTKNSVNSQNKKYIPVSADSLNVTAERVNGIVDELNKVKAYSKPIVTELTAYTAFYKAEAYHQNYYNDNKSEAYCRMVIQPKIEKFEKVFKNRIKK